MDILRRWMKRHRFVYRLRESSNLNRVTAQDVSTDRTRLEMSVFDFVKTFRSSRQQFPHARFIVFVRHARWTQPYRSFEMCKNQSFTFRKKKLLIKTHGDARCEPTPNNYRRTRFQSNRVSDIGPLDV